MNRHEHRKKAAELLSDIDKLTRQVKDKSLPENDAFFVIIGAMGAVATAHAVMSLEAQNVATDFSMGD